MRKTTLPLAVLLAGLLVDAFGLRAAIAMFAVGNTVLGVSALASGVSFSRR